MPRLSIVVLNWNGIAHLPECLESLQRQLDEDYQVIVVDNGSVDGSIEYIMESFPDVQVVANSTNLGFCEGANQGIETAEGEFVLLLNNDTRCEPNFLREVIHCWSTAPGDVIGIFPKVLYYDRPDVINSAGARWTRFGFWQPFSDGRPDSNAGQHPWYVFGDRFIAPCFRANLIRALGGFDEDFFSFHEDLDVCYRANLSGYRFLLCPSAVVYHKMSQTLKDGTIASSLKLRLGLRNYAFVLIKNYSMLNLLLYSPWFVLRVYLYNGMVRSIKNAGVRASFEVLGAVVGAAFDVLKGLPSAVRKRPRVQRARLVKDGEVWSRPEEVCIGT